MTPLAAYLILFVAVGAAFILVHLLLGKLLRPAKPSAEKGTIYECGEPTIGSAWIQFDLRFYVVALLFVIFDVEVAFFFPWAEVFGKANTIAAFDKPATAAEYNAYANKVLELSPTTYRSDSAWKNDRELLKQLAEVDEAGLEGVTKQPSFKDRFDKIYRVNKESASGLGWLALGEIFVFFGVLLVGFAYLWKRGDLAWVRSVAAERPATTTVKKEEPTLVGAGIGL
jgi:NADH-quinone oxidoreductase subunit A